METTPYQRLEAFWLSKGLKNMSAFAEAVKLKPATLSAIKQRSSQPSNAVMQAMQLAFPDLSARYVLWGDGPMLNDGRSLRAATDTDEPTPPPASPAAAAGLPADLLDKLLAQINTAADRHREEIAEVKKEHKATLATNNRYLQRVIETLEIENRELKQKVYFLEGRLGLRAYTPEEQAAAQQQVEPPRPKVKGLKNYDHEAPQGVECGLQLAYSNPSFIRPPDACPVVLPLEVSRRKAA